MNKYKIAVTIDGNIIEHLDSLVKKHIFANRSQAIQEAVREKLERLDRSRLARECAKLNPALEKEIAEEGISGELNEWPAY